MKQLNLTILICLSLFISACKKDIYGCTDETALNYSTFANTDDGSCYFDNIETGFVTISNWTWSDPSYYATVTYDAITQDVIYDGAVLAYILTGTDTYEQLPLTYYPSTTWSTSIELVSFVGSLNIIWTDSDHATLNPGTRTFKIVVIKNKRQVTDEEISREVARKK